MLQNQWLLHLPGASPYHAKLQNIQPNCKDIKQWYWNNQRNTRVFSSNVHIFIFLTQLINFTSTKGITSRVTKDRKTTISVQKYLRGYNSLLGRIVMTWKPMLTTIPDVRRAAYRAKTAWKYTVWVIHNMPMTLIVTTPIIWQGMHNIRYTICSKWWYNVWNPPEYHFLANTFY